jgi:abortive infection bacteriophage resistance protein
MKFSKPALPLPDLLAKLQARSLQVSDGTRAMHHLRFIGYYRLSAYALAFQQVNTPGKPFLPGTTFEDVLGLYHFDRELRLLVIDAIERIEVAVRSVLISEMSVRHGPHWFMESRHFSPHYGYINQLLAKVERDTRASRETFIIHYRTKYTDPCLPPAWATAENLTFGTLSYLFAALNSADRKVIAAPFGCDEQILRSWLHCLAYLRNLCAHHSRLWNRVFSITPAIAKRHAKILSYAQRDRFYALAVVLFELVKAPAPSTGWHERLKALLASHPNVPLSAMGFPDGWQSEPFWNPS